MPYLLGLDIGTSGAKALLCDEAGRVLATATAEYGLSAPYPLWSEQDPLDWWRGSQEALRDVLKEASIDATQIVGLGLTGQMHGATFLGTGGDIVRPALLWNDQRTGAECDEITLRVGAPRLIEIAGNPALTGFQAPKILWLRNHEPDNFARVQQVLLPKDYIRLKLTGVSATDAADAAGTLLLDLHKRDWSDEILTALDIPRDWLPKVYEGPHVTGSLLEEVADGLGLPSGIPVIAGGGDNAAAAIGTGIVKTGVVNSSIGTSGVLFAHADKAAFDPQGRLHSFCHSVPSQYHLMAVTLAAGGSLRWMRDLLRESDSGTHELSYNEMATAAGMVPPGSEGLLFLPYLTGERTPHLDPLARGSFVGLTTRHGAAHMIRAVMEGVVFSLRDGLTIMRDLGIAVDEIRATGGGARSPLWRQMQADIYGTSVVTLVAEEGPAYGAALLAGVGAGLFADVHDAVNACVQVDQITEPNPEAQEKYNYSYSVYRDLYSNLRDSMHRLSKSATT